MLSMMTMRKVWRNLDKVANDQIRIGWYGQRPVGEDSNHNNEVRSLVIGLMMMNLMTHILTTCPNRVHDGNDDNDDYEITVMRIFNV